MVDDRPQADRILVAQLTGEARHRAKWRPLSSGEEDQAIAELATLAGGRADLLAQVAGIFEGASEGELDEPLARCAARLCRLAGADPEEVPAWIEEGRKRRAAARKAPPSGGVRGLSQKSRRSHYLAAAVFPQDGERATAQNTPLPAGMHKWPGV